MFATKVPLFDRLPLIFSVFDPEIVSVAPEFMVRLLQRPPAAPITGWFPPALMITLVAEVGTDPLHQLLGVFQSVLT